MEQNNLLLIGKMKLNISKYDDRINEELIYYLLHKIDFIKDRSKNDRNRNKKPI